jgi:hypothetical protein
MKILRSIKNAPAHLAAVAASAAMSSPAFADGFAKAETLLEKSRLASPVWPSSPLPSLLSGWVTKCYGTAKAFTTVKGSSLAAFLLPAVQKSALC